MSNKESLLNIVSYEEFKEQYEKGGNFLLIIGRDDCPNCIALRKMIENKNIELVEHDILYLKYTSANKEEFLRKIEYYFDDIEMIPYYALIEKGHIEKTGQGYEQEEDFLAFIESAK